MEPLFDLELIQSRRHRAIVKFAEGADFLMVRAVEDLQLRLSATQRQFRDAALIHCLTPHAAQFLLQDEKVQKIVAIEADNHLPCPYVETYPSAMEAVALPPASTDLAISVLSLHSTNDTPGLLTQIRRTLRPDGMFLGCMAGAGTLSELRECMLQAETEITGGASPRIHPLPDVRAAGSLLQRAGFALPVTDHETLTVRYDGMFELIRDLRAMGSTGALAKRSRKPLSSAVFLRADEIYRERFSDPDGRIRASFSFVWMSGWAPDPSQQQPLKPGSASHSLSRALGGKSS